MVTWIAAALSFLMAGVTAYSAVNASFILIPLTAIPLFAGIGILRRRVWSAYGFCLYLGAQLAILGLALLRPGGPTLPQSAAIALVIVLLMVLFAATGRSLMSAGAARGRAVPWIVVSALSIAPFLFFQPFVIPTGAMENTLAIGDRILVQRFPKPAVAQGDLVVFQSPADHQQVFIQRVVGMPGDRIRISNKVVFRNGTPLREPYAVHKTAYLDHYRDNFPSAPEPPGANHAHDMLARHVVDGEVVVPQGKYFVLGDNRDNSLDSRYLGFVDAAELLGRPKILYSSAAPGRSRPQLL